MNDKELLEYMRKVNTNFNTHLENGTIEMSLEYYNLCEELMARGINAMQENQQLKEQLEEAEKDYDRIFGLWHNRKLIKKFDDEYNEEDKKKNPNRNYAYIMPDAEEVYKRYYELKEQLQQKEDVINKAKEKNKQIIKDTKSFYRPTSDRIYSGDCLIELATENIEILNNKGDKK